MIKPYFETKLGKLYCGDCLKIMGNISSKKVDLIYADPVWPNAAKEFVKYGDPYKNFNLLAKKMRKLTMRIIIHLGIDSDPRILKSIPKKFKFFRVCWLKYAFPHCKGRLLYSGDIAYLFGPPPKSRPGFHLVPGERCSSENTGNKTGHPCSRKLSHVQWLISKFSTKNDLILDPYLGSGTAAVACEKLGREWIGIEISKKYCEIAARYIRNEARQEKLF